MFFFCNAVDDALMGVTHVLRGDDHLSNTPRQLLLLQALGLPAPRYGHLPLLLDASGAPLSKRRGSATVGELRAAATCAAAVGNYLLRLGHTGAPDGWVEPADFAAALRRRPARPRAGAFRCGAARSLAARGRAAPGRRQPPRAGSAPNCRPTGRRSERAGARGAAARQRAAPGRRRATGSPCCGGELPPLAAGRSAVHRGGGAGILRRRARRPTRETGADLAALVRAPEARTGRKGKALFMPLRFALTGRRDGPELAALLPAIPPALVRDAPRGRGAVQCGG